MKDWRKVVIKKDVSVREAIRIIDDAALKIAIVVDEENRVLGTVTDGDVRRGILRGVPLEGSVEDIMHKKPTLASEGAGREEILSLMRAKELLHIPIVDSRGRLVGLEIVEEALGTSRRSNCVVIMAGGMGTRLRPYTEDCPKPLLKVGGRPILETILMNFIDYGFTRFYFSVNYKAEMIQVHFGDGSRWGVDIRYIHEEKRLGTAGALSLLPESPTEPLVVMNGDVLTRVNFEQLLSFHSETKAAGTMCVREYDFQVPFGVTVVDNHRLLSIEEKPVQRFFVNAGIYVLEPQALKLIPSNTYMDMPSVFEQILGMEENASVFPIREYWLDLGRIEDFTKAQGEFKEEFQ